MCRVQTFCFCGTLRSAAITAAVLNALYVIGSLVNGYLYLKNASHRRDGGGTEDRVLGAILIIEVIVGIIVLVFLILGIRRNRPGFILPWLIAAFIIILIGIISPIALFVSGHHWLDLLFGLLIAIFWLYVWICVLSYYKELQGGVTTYHP